MEYLLALFLIASLIYIVFLRSKFAQMREDLMFDNRVLGCVDGLLFALESTGTVLVAKSSARSYVKELLAQAHRIPGNQFLIEHTAPDGYTYHSHTGLYGEHYLFAILCLAKYAQDHSKEDLLTWCDSLLNQARTMSYL